MRAVVHQQIQDGELRHETGLFTALNRWLLALLFLLSLAYGVLLSASQPRTLSGLEFGVLFVWLNRLGLWLLTFFALLPLAMTMALIWKTKETILDSVFGAK